MMRMINVPLIQLLVVASLVAAPARAPRITQIYTTGETATSATVVWSTSTASDSLLQYSTSNPVPANAPQIYRAGQVTVHDIPLSGLTPGTLYFYKVTSCSKKACVTAQGSFETSPACPDVVPAVTGSWQKDFSPNVAGTSISNQLLGVTAVSETDVWSVGWAHAPNGPSYVKRTLIEHFDGRAWNIVASPNPLTHTNSVLYSVSGAAANDVWAVGSSHNGSLPSRTLIEHWDGTEWSIVASPNPDTAQFNELRGVAGLSAKEAWAVGYRGGSRTETPIETLILRWDGVRWRQVASPNIAGAANQLFGITAISASDIWAVGSAGGAPLALHWDGTSWSIVSPGIGSGLSSERLNAVSGTAANDVWAVGEARGIFTNQTFATIWHWNGVRWTEKTCRAASASNPPDGYEGGGPNAYFTGVAAAAKNDVWAVGVLGSGPMILHWDGRAWTSVSHPRAFPNAASLGAVATSRSGAAWSVGLEVEVDSFSANPERTLINRYIP